MTLYADSFSTSYAQARDKFLSAAQANGLQVQSHIHPLKGRDGETLAMDVALDGPADAPYLLIVSSACHGVEGYCGSGVQVDALRHTAWRERARANGVAVLWVHALNPYGFSYWRRTTHENVDINRNFQDFSKPLPVNANYPQLHNWLLPAQWPPTPENEAALAQWVAQHGQVALRDAISGGQYTHPDGLFFGGQAPTWSQQTLRQVLREHGTRCKRLAWIDLHTGLGPSGVGERIFACRDDAAAFARAKAWWGSAQTPITSIYDGSSTSAPLTGLMWLAAYQECPQAEYTGIAMEYGTIPFAEVTQALRADQWLQMHPQAPADLAQRIKADILRAFYTQTDVWKEQIVVQARESIVQAIAGLAHA